MKIRIGILGLGHIGYYHIKALDSFPEYELIAACDLNLELKEILPKNALFFKDIEQFLKADFDTVIIATPNKTHFELGCRAYEAGKNAIMEKPAGASLEEFEKMDIRFKDDPNRHIYYAFHAAKAFDVAWFKEYYFDKKNFEKLGPITSFSCNFYDPYFEQGAVKEEAGGLQNCWIDSGVNALSVLAEIMDLRNFKLVSFSKIQPENKGIFVQALAQFHFPVKDKEVSGMGVIDTNWTLGLNQKKTRLFFACSGYAVELDHTGQRVTLTSSDKKVTVLKDFNKTGERLHNHYVGVFRDYLTCRKNNKFNNSVAKIIHQKLFSVES